MAKRILMLGCGDLGIRTARVLQSQGYHIVAARRSVDRLPADLDKMPVDVTDASSFSKLQETQWDAIIVSLTARGEDAYKKVYVGGVVNLLAAMEQSSQSPYIIFVSSTSIYHQKDGETVDEHSPTEPDGYSGRTMLQAEQALQQSGLPSSAVRFSGIYGAGQGGKVARGGHLLEVMREGRIAPQSPVRYSNRIHIDDCVGVLVFLVERYFSGKPVSPVYLGSDGDPANLHEVMAFLAQQEGINVDQLVPDYLPARGGNKQCKGVLLQEQGYAYRHPSYRSGYA